jgi:AraC family transcriptional regulator
LIARLSAKGARAHPADPRIAKLIAWVAPRLDESVRLSDAATFIGLSPGRARHLFVQQTGAPLRRYLLWLRHATRHLNERATTSDGGKGKL